MFELAKIIVLAPLFGALLAGLFGQQIGRKGSHVATITGVLVACVLSCWVLYQYAIGAALPLNQAWYQWAQIGGVNLEVGFMIDSLTAMMMVVVTFVSLMVHIYTIGYMSEDPGYQRFFSYISLFTFAMLMLVMSNNFLQLFFGWEAVGLVSYLLIGFWFKKSTATYANLKAFLVNRVGDFGFLLGIATVFYLFGSLDYADVFAGIPKVVDSAPTMVWFSDIEWSAVTVACILLFIGAMGKSAQVPLHVWLPDSMEGPTPISALIHAATMVTAGVFMVARLSPLFEQSETALCFILVIGTLTAFFMGLMGLVQNDIKRVIAYSTLSQLGYMVVALGVSAYSAALFHLMTHAFFKALLFLGAGSVIIGMHHIQDIRQMGNIKKYMPVTYITSLIGTLALVGTPFFSGFYSKDAIIEAVHYSNRFGADIAYYALLAGVFITSLYSFRLFFWVFHTKERMDSETRSHLKESPGVVWLPLVLLAIPSVAIAWFSVEPMLFGSFFDGAVFVLPENNSLIAVSDHFHGVVDFAIHGFQTVPFWLMVSGAICGYAITRYNDAFKPVKKLLSGPRWILDHKYGFDQFNQAFFANGSVKLGQFFNRLGEQIIIDGGLVNGSAKVIGALAGVIRRVQTGYLYHYAFVMMAGLFAFVFWYYWRT